MCFIFFISSFSYNSLKFCVYSFFTLFFLGSKSHINALIENGVNIHDLSKNGFAVIQFAAYKVGFCCQSVYLKCNFQSVIPG